MKTSASFCRVSALRQGSSSACLILLINVLISPLAYGQQWRAADLPPPPTQALAQNADTAETQESRAELRRERKMQWLKSANGAANGAANGSGTATTRTSAHSATEFSELRESSVVRGRMGDMSREERHRLRSDIREAGFSAYSVEGKRRRP